MLNELYIENLAVIEKAVIKFDKNLNIFTGETGAGKSILIGGINAISGGRVYKDIVRRGAERGVVTALFSGLPEGVQQALQERGYGSTEGELLVEREISADGKSTARINGKVTTVSILKEIASDLIDIHGQHDSKILMDNENHRELLDNFGNYDKVIGDYQESFKSFSAISRRIKKLEAERSQAELHIAYLSRNIEEIEQHNLSFGDDERITSQLNAARNKEAILTATGDAVFALGGDDDTDGAIALIRRTLASLKATTDYGLAYQSLTDRLESAEIELADILHEIEQSLPDEGEEIDIIFLEEKMSAIASLKRKYQLELDAILSNCEEWKEELFELQNCDDTIEQLKEKKRLLGEELKSFGSLLTESRKTAAAMLAEQISEELRYLDMPDVVLCFDVSPDKVTVHGMDRVEILISVNKGESLKPIAKTASGGELSRIMLAIKSCLSESDDIPTMIFDEIDTGISGRAASKVAQKLAALSGRRQVLCVTHLAQIAAKATNHLLIEKTSTDERTFTSVRSLQEEGRKAEIARIISGDLVGESAIKAAEELLNGC